MKTVKVVPSVELPATTSIDTPVGRMTLAATRHGLTHALFDGSAKMPLRKQDRAGEAERRHLEAAARALREYFGGKRRGFNDLALAPQGTPFQRRVWQALRSIRCGTTRTYGEIAAMIRKPRAARAVGLANNRNPIAIIIPCHRVIGANGDLVGYGGGLDVKRWLLAHERAHMQKAAALLNQGATPPIPKRD